MLWVALGVLVIMTLAGLAMLRQMGGGVSIAGNLAFKQSATSLADLGTEQARALITAAGANLIADNASAGYYATWSANPDPTVWAEWTSAPEITDGVTGNKVKYVIHRLCELVNVDANGPLQHCSSEGASPPDKGSPGGGFKGIVRPYFRITTRVEGPRNTVSYIQVIAN